jgi:uncharacterized protein (DUF433 family)
MLETAPQLPVPVRADDHGVLRIGNTRVTLDSVASEWQNGATPEEIALRFPSLEVREVYAVCAWALWHREEVERYLEQRRGQAEALQTEITQRTGLTGLRERLLARRG